MPEVKLNLGCGKRKLEGYVNIDLQNWGPGQCDILADARDLDMFEDGSVDRIVTAGLLEHIPPWQTLPALREWHRVLKPGGTIRVAVPDLERIFRGWLVEGTVPEQRALDFIFGGDKVPNLYGFYKYYDHLTGFTFERLARLLQEAGFQDCERAEHWRNRDVVLVVEARK